MTVLYVIVGGLIALSLALYIVVHTLNTKKKKNAMKSKAQARAGAKKSSNAETPASTDGEPSFIPSGHATNSGR